MASRLVYTLEQIASYYSDCPPPEFESDVSDFLVIECQAPFCPFRTPHNVCAFSRGKRTAKYSPVIPGESDLSYPPGFESKPEAEIVGQPIADATFASVLDDPPEPFSPPPPPPPKKKPATWQELSQKKPEEPVGIWEVKPKPPVASFSELLETAASEKPLIVEDSPEHDPEPEPEPERPAKRPKRNGLDMGRRNVPIDISQIALPGEFDHLARPQVVFGQPPLALPAAAERRTNGGRPVGFNPANFAVPGDARGPSMRPVIAYTQPLPAGRPKGF
jgi:hypothetical protein